MMSTKILCVCEGNTCRSPMLEGLLRKKFAEGTQVESAGVHPAAKRHQRPSRLTISCMEWRGVDIRDHRSRHIDSVDLSQFSLILVMTHEIRRVVRSREYSGKIMVLNIENPKGSPEFAYERCALELEAAADIIAGVH